MKLDGTLCQRKNEALPVAVIGGVRGFDGLLVAVDVVLHQGDLGGERAHLGMHADVVQRDRREHACER